MVSVILPVYNAEKTIVETVASVLCQTRSNLELIIINDGSNDQTLSLLFQISDPRVRVFSFSRAGVSTSRNRGIARAGGEYIAFIDADDLWGETKLEMQLSALAHHPDALVAYCWADYIDAKGTRLFADQRPRFEGDVYKAFLTGNFIDSGSTVMVHRDALARVNGFEPTLLCFEDWDLYVRLAKLYRFVLVPRVLVSYRLHPGTLTTDIGLMETNFQRFLNRTFKDVSPPLSGLKAKNQACTYAYLTAKATQGLPSGKDSVTAFRLFGKAVCAWPGGFWHPCFKPWVLKALAKALLCLVLPRKVVKKVAGVSDRFQLFIRKFQ